MLWYAVPTVTKGDLMHKTPEWQFDAKSVVVEAYPSKETIRELLATFLIYAKDDPTKRLAVDLETTGLDPFCGEITLVAFSWTGNVVYVCRPEDIPVEEFNAVMASEHHLKVFHNGKFDMKWLMVRFGSEFENCDDTMIMRQLLTAGIDKPANLKSCVAEYFAYEMDKAVRDEFVNNTGPVTTEMLQYAAVDVAATWALYPLLRNEIFEHGLDLCHFNIEAPCVAVIASMEVQGIGVDLGYCNTLEVKLAAKVDETKTKLDARLIELGCMPTTRRKLKKAELIERGIPKFLTPEDKAAKRVNPEYEKDHYEEEEVDSFNVNSPPQCVQVLNSVGFDVKKADRAVLEAPNSTKESLQRARENFGDPTLTDKQVLDTGFEIIALLRMLRGAQKQLSSFILPLQQVRPMRWNDKDEIKGKFLNPVTGKVHPNFNQIGSEDNGVATGRMSCDSPNFQQMPAPKDGDDPIYEGLPFRRCFVAPPGRKFVVFDYSGCELRILAEITQDPKMIAAMHHAKPHKVNAAAVYNVPIESLTDDQIKKIKITTFGDIYGMGANKLAGTLQISVSEARDVKAKLASVFAGAEQWKKSVRAVALNEGYALSMSGRKRFFQVPQAPVYDPKLNGPDFDYAAAVREYRGKRAAIERQAVNTPIQGTNADITKLAMVMLHRELKGLDAKIIFAVHDEIGVECDEAIADRVYEIMERVMLAAEAEFLDKVPCKVDGKIDSYWNK